MASLIVVSLRSQVCALVVQILMQLFDQCIQFFCSGGSHSSFSLLLDASCCNFITFDSYGYLHHLQRMEKSWKSTNSVMVTLISPRSPVEKISVSIPNTTSLKEYPPLIPVAFRSRESISFRLFLGSVANGDLIPDDRRVRTIVVVSKMKEDDTRCGWYIFHGGWSFAAREISWQGTLWTNFAYESADVIIPDLRMGTYDGFYGWTWY